LVPAVFDHIEIIGETPPLVLNRIYDAHACRNAGPLQTLRKQQREPLLVSRGDQNLEHQLSAALALDEFRAAEFVAGGGQQVERAFERSAVAAGAVADRRRPGAIEHVGANRVGKRRKQCSLPVIGRSPMRRQFRVVEKARAASIEIEEISVIDPLEVEQQRDRLAHANIGEDCTPGVEHVVAARLRHPGG
jgi:hypothetical protein